MQTVAHSDAPADNARNLLLHAARYIPGSEVHQEAGFCRIRTGIPARIFNGVFQTRLPHQVVQQHIRDTAAYFSRTETPMEWMVEPGHQPHNLPDLLVDNGFHLAYSSPAMVLPELAHFQPADIPAELSISLVSTEQDLEDLATVLPVFGLEETVTEGYIGMCRHMLRDRRLQHFVGRADGMTVACGAAFYQCETLGVYTIGTVEPARGRGYGSALTSHILEEGRQRGCRHAVLTSSKLGLSVYKYLGFEQVGSIPYYTM